MAAHHIILIKRSNSMISSITIIICTYNGASRLNATLKHLANLCLDEIDVELVVVDNASTDNTGSMVLECWEEYNSPFVMRLVIEESKGIMYARKRGLREARNEVVVFVDDDNNLHPQYLIEVLKTFNSDPSIAQVGGFNEGVFDGDLPKWFFQHWPFKSLHNTLAVHGPEFNSSDFIFGAGSAYRLSALRHIKELGFPAMITGRSGEKLSSGDDEELSLALQIAGFKIKYNEKMRLGHVIPRSRLTWGYFKRLHEGFGVAYPLLLVYRSILSSKVSNIALSDVELKIKKKLMKANLVNRLFSLIGLKKNKAHLLSSEYKSALDEITQNRKYYEDGIRKILAFKENLIRS